MKIDQNEEELIKKEKEVDFWEKFHRVPSESELNTLIKDKIYNNREREETNILDEEDIQPWLNLLRVKAVRRRHWVHQPQKHWN